MLCEPPLGERTGRVWKPKYFGVTAASILAWATLGAFMAPTPCVVVVPPLSAWAGAFVEPAVAAAAMPAAVSTRTHVDVFNASSWRVMGR